MEQIKMNFTSPPPKIPDNIKALSDQYAKAHANILKKLEADITAGKSTRYTKDLLKSVEREMYNLDKFTAEWLKGNIPDQYKMGIDEAYNKYREAGVDIVHTEVNTKAVNAIINNGIQKTAVANAYVGRHIEDTLRAIGLELAGQKFTEGKTLRETQRLLLERLTKDGLLDIKDKNGRSINPTAYANMVGRTTTREATNQGILYQVTSSGNDLVFIPVHHTACPICAVFEGRVYSVSGKDKNYPPLSKAFRGGYSTIHPNCKHNAVPYIRRLDKDADAKQKESNRKFELRPEDQEKIDRYNKEQAKLAERRKLKAQWEKERAENPDGTPKTFAGYLTKRTKELKKNPPVPKVPKPKAPPKTPPTPATMPSLNPLSRNYSTVDDAYKSVNLSGIESTYAETIKDRLLDLANKYPVDTESLKVRTGEDAGAFGWFARGLKQNKVNRDMMERNRELFLSTTYHNTEINSIKTHGENAKARASKLTHSLQTIDHEYAHAIDHESLMRAHPELRTRIIDWDGKEATTREDILDINEITGLIQNNDKYISNVVFNRMKKEMGLGSFDFNMEVVDELGTYAGTDRAEFLAEAFTHYRNIPPEQHSDFLKKFGEVFEDEWQKVGQ